MNKVSKRFCAVFACAVLLLQLLIVTAYAAGGEPLQDGVVNIGNSALTGAVQIVDSADLLIVDGPYKTLYKVNFLTGELKSANLAYTPSSVDYSDNQIYVGCGAQSIILIYDLSSLTLMETISTSSTFFDMKVGNDGYIYTIGSGNVYSYSPSGKNMVSRLGVGYNGILEKHPYYNSFYFTRQGISPSDVHVFTYDNGQIKTSYDSRYHGDYVEGYRNRITPDGEFLINSTGNIARVSPVKTEDIMFSFALGNSFSDLCFDESGDRFFSVSGKKITQYKTSTFEQINTFETEKNADRIFFYGNRLVALQKNNIGLYYAERLNTSAVPLPEELAPSTKTLTQTENKINLDIDNLVASRFVEQTGELLLLSPTYLYKINTADNTQTKIRFPYIATKLAVHDNTVFVGGGRQGVVCLYDLQTMNYKKTIFTDELFRGMEVGDDGYLYTGETGAWETARCGFNVETGERIERIEDTYGLADYKKAPVGNAFYYIDDWGYFARRTYSDGKITSTKTFGSRDGYGTLANISPDGEYIIFRSGSIAKFVSADDAINFYYKLAVQVADACFSSDSVYVALFGKQIYAYDMDTFEGTATYETQGYSQNVFVSGDTLISLSKTTEYKGNYYDANTGSFFIETIKVDDPDTTIETTVTSKSLSYENGRALLGVKENAKTVFNGSMMYVADSSEKAIFAVDTVKMTETKVAFPDAPNSLYYYENELFVGFGNNGLIVVLDASTFAVKDKFFTGSVFIDMAIGNDGNIYIIEKTGSPWWETYARSYSMASKQMIGSLAVGYKGVLEKHPQNNSFYFIRQGVSPSDIHVFTYNNGEITATYDSPYHGGYPLGKYVKISPDGRNLFTSGGSVFIPNDVRAMDMQYRCKFTSFSDLAFDLANNQMFTSNSTKNLDVYSYTTFEKKGFIKTISPVVNMAVQNDSIIALSSENKAFYLENLNSFDILQLAPEKITVNTSDTILLGRASYISLYPTIHYNDGTSQSITNNVLYMSSDEAVATVTASGRVQAVGRGYAEITIKSEGITKVVNIYVDTDVDSIEVDGYNIDFETQKTSYTVMLPTGTTSVPTINVIANESFDVKVSYPASLPGTATITVGGNGTIRKTYGIYFYIQREALKPITADPEGGEVEKGTLVTLTAPVEGANVFYRIDGSYNKRYDGPIIVDRPMTISAFYTVDYGGITDWSPITDFTYTLKPAITTTVSVPNVEGERGKEVEVDVIIQNNTGIAAFVFDINFGSGLTLVSAEKGEVLSKGNFITEADEGEVQTDWESIKSVWLSESNVTADGTLFKLRFEVSDDTQLNNLPIYISYIKGDVLDEDFNDVEIVAVGGSIALPVMVFAGDVNGDGVVSVKDGLKLTQYLSGHDIIFSEQEMEAADVNGDGVVDIKDGLRMTQYLAGWDVKLGK